MAAAAPVVIDIPGFNGFVHIGLAAIGDAKLPEAKRCQVIEAVDLRTSASMTAVATVTHWEGNLEPKLRTLLAGAAYATVFYGLCGNYTYNGDAQAGGEFVARDMASISQANIDNVRGELTADSIRNGLTVIFATKMNFYHMNHHVGQGVGSQLMHKVSQMIIGESATGDVLNVFHAIGHWASTHIVFNILGITTGIEVDPRLYPDQARENRDMLEMTDDFKVRLDGMPAGAARHGLCYSFVKKYCTTPHFTLIPKPEALLACFTEVDTIVKRHEEFKRYGAWGQDPDFYTEIEHGPYVPAEGEEGTAPPQVAPENRVGEQIIDGRKYILLTPEALKVFKAEQISMLDVIHRTDPRLPYHMGATFLTGRPRVTFSSADQIGIIGSILRYNFSSHTMTRSPHIMNGTHAAYAQVESFDANFDGLMSRLALATVKVTDDEAKRIVGISSSKLMNRETFVAFRVGAGFSQEDATRDYDILEARDAGDDSDGDDDDDDPTDKAVARILAAMGAVSQEGAKEKASVETRGAAAKRKGPAPSEEEAEVEPPKTGKRTKKSGSKGKKD